MKNLIVISTLLGLIGCNQATNADLKQSTKPVETKMKYGLDLKDYPKAKVDFTLGEEFEYVAVENYGAIAFKVIDSCYVKYETTISNIDTSTEYGSAKYNDYRVNVAKCVTETLNNYERVPENLRQEIPREYNGLELDESEIESFYILPAFEYDKNSERYKKVLKACERDNIASPKKDFASNVEFCVAKSM